MSSSSVSLVASDSVMEGAVELDGGAAAAAAVLTASVSVPPSTPFGADSAGGEALVSAGWRTAATLSMTALAGLVYTKLLRQYSPLVMVNRGTLKISYMDMLHTALQCLLTPDTEASRTLYSEKIERLWDPTGHTMTTFCVRSAFDLLLSTLALPQGTEVLMSALTIKDMVKIVQHHGLVPVPVDLHVDTCEPILQLAEKLVSPRTRMFVFAPLFGTRFDTQPLVEFCRQHNLLLVQDCAQGFDGLSYKGEPQADVVLWSFGAIKTATALGGGLMTVRDATLLERLRAAHRAYPVQPQRALYLRRVAKYLLWVPLTRDPDAMGLFDLLCRAAGTSADEMITRKSRSFPGSDLFAQIRLRPCTALLWLLHKRLSTWNDREIIGRVAQTYHQLALLPPAVVRPGAAAPYHNYWVCPLLARDSLATQRALRRAGIDSTVSASQLHVVPQPPALQHEPVRGPASRPLNAEYMMQHIFYIPTYLGVPLWATHRIADVITRVCTEPMPPPPRDRPRARL